MYKIIIFLLMLTILVMSETMILKISVDPITPDDEVEMIEDEMIEDVASAISAPSPVIMDTLVEEPIPTTPEKDKEYLLSLKEWTYHGTELYFYRGDPPTIVNARDNDVVHYRYTSNIYITRSNGQIDRDICPFGLFHEGVVRIYHAAGIEIKVKYNDDISNNGEYIMLNDSLTFIQLYNNEDGLYTSMILPPLEYNGDNKEKAFKHVNQILGSNKIKYLVKESPHKFEFYNKEDNVEVTALVDTLNRWLDLTNNNNGSYIVIPKL